MPNSWAVAVGFSAPAEPGPWLQVLVLVNAVYLLSLAVFTLPLYSLCVQLSGEDYNPKYLPDDIVQNARLMRKVRPPCLLPALSGPEPTSH